MQWYNYKVPTSYLKTCLDINRWDIVPSHKSWRDSISHHRTFSDTWHVTRETVSFYIQNKSDYRIYHKHTIYSNPIGSFNTLLFRDLTAKSLIQQCPITKPVIWQGPVVRKRVKFSQWFPGAPLRYFSDERVQQKFTFYTLKNPNFKICIPKKSHTSNKLHLHYCGFDLMKSTIPHKIPVFFRDPKNPRVFHKPKKKIFWPNFQTPKNPSDPPPSPK